MTETSLIPVPSGQPVTLQEVITNIPGQGQTYRFRFVAPEMAESLGVVDFSTLEPDMEHLCNSYALERIPNIGPQPNRIVISMAQRPTVFGAPNPEILQIFESYSIGDNTCIWEAF